VTKTNWSVQFMFIGSEGAGGGHFVLSVAGVLDEPYNQLTTLSRLAIQASQST
jgi:hypothetical protein